MIGVGLLTAALLGAPPAVAATRTFHDPQTADSGAYFMQTSKIVVHNNPRKVVVTAYGTYYWRYIDRVDLSLSTARDAKCWDLRSTTPHKRKTQKHVFFGVHCGDFHRVRCPKARIYADPNHHYVRFTIPQACVGRPVRLKGSLSFEDVTAGLYNQSDFGFVRRG